MTEARKLTEQEEINLATLNRLAKAFEEQDVDAILENFHEEGVFDSTEGPEPWGQRFKGKAEIRKSVEGVFATLPDVRFVEATRWVCGNNGVADWTCVATTPKGHPMRVKGCDIFELRDGLVIRKDTYFKKVVRKKD